VTKREAAQRLKDLETGQRAFAALRPGEQTAIVDALHAEQVELIVDRAHRDWTFLLDQFERSETDAGTVITQWRERLARAPEHLHHELEWADTLFEASATARVCHEVRIVLPATGPAKVERWLTERLSWSVGPGTSSSTSHNLMRAFEAKAYARALESLRWGL